MARDGPGGFTGGTEGGDRVWLSWLQRAANPVQQILVPERLSQHDLGAILQGTPGVLELVVGRHDDDRNIVSATLQLLLQLETGHARHAQIQDHALVCTRGVTGEEILRVQTGHRLPATGAHQHAHRRAHCIVIVHHVDA